MIYTSEEDREDILPEEAEPIRFDRPGKQGSAVPVLQAVACALILLALAIAKFARPELFSQITDWYHAEQTKLIELPSWTGQDAAEPTDVLAETESGSLLRV